LWPEHSLDWELLIQRPLWFLLLSILWLPLAYAFDAHDLRVAGRLSTTAPAVLKAGAITAVVYLLIPYLPPALPSSRLSLFAFILLVFIFLLAGRGLYVLALAQPYFGRRALIIGAGWAGRTMVTGRQGDTRTRTRSYSPLLPLTLSPPLPLSLSGVRWTAWSKAWRSSPCRCCTSN
jgi:FlaA1/EpsC-like NDP-sugar epimerase